MGKTLQLWVLAAACSVCAEVQIYDFGKADSPLHDNAIRVTAQNSDNVTWGGKRAQRREIAHKIDHGKRLVKSRGEKIPPQRYHTALSCDHIFSTNSESLLIKVPPGRYKTLFLCGKSGTSGIRIWDIKISGSEGETTAATFAGNNETRALYLDSTASDQGLFFKIETRSFWLINGMVVVPFAKWESVKNTIIKDVIRDNLMLPPEIMKQWKEQPVVNTEPKPEWSKQHKADGIAVFSRTWNEPVWPDHYPRASEIDAPVESFATLGEYEPLTFTLHALKSFEKIDLSLGDLTSDKGIIKSDSIDKRFVRYMYVRPNYAVLDKYYRAPDVLMPWQQQELASGENLRIWLTIKVPDDLPPGNYTGCATITADQSKIDVPIALRVLPFKLKRDNSLVYGQFYDHPYHCLQRNHPPFSQEWWQNKAQTEHKDMREHGNNCLVHTLRGSLDENNRWVLDFDELDAKIKLGMKFGLNKRFPLCVNSLRKQCYQRFTGKISMAHLLDIEIPPQEYFDKITELVELIKAESAKHEWPELLYYPVDEPGRNPMGAEFTMRTLQAIKRVPGVRTFVTADPKLPVWEPLHPYVDVWCHPHFLDRDFVLEQMKNKKVEYWCYPNCVGGSSNDHTPVTGARMTYGFGFWYSGYCALLPYTYQKIIGDQWNYLDAWRMDFFNRTGDDGSPIPVTLWEAYREGIDDHSYLHTLECEIKRVRQAGFVSEADKAQVLVDKLFARVAGSAQARYQYVNLWDPAEFNQWRWELATQIMVLQKLR